MLKRLIFVLVTTVLLTGLAYAHGDPIMGTVTAVASDTVTIKDKDNKPVVIMLVRTLRTSAAWQLPQVSGFGRVGYNNGSRGG
jgi:hypothetical protein